MDCKADAAGDHCRAVDPEQTRPDTKAANFTRGLRKIHLHLVYHKILLLMSNQEDIALRRCRTGFSNEQLSFELIHDYKRESA